MMSMTTRGSSLLLPRRLSALSVVPASRSFGLKRKPPKSKKKDAITPTRENPVRITPVLNTRRWGWNSQLEWQSSPEYHFKLEDFIEQKSFRKLIDIYKKSDIKFDRRWTIPLTKLDPSSIGQLRSELEKESFELDRFPGLEAHSSPALHTTERISLGLEDKSVAILQVNKAYLIICPDKSDIIRLVTDQLTGVTDTITCSQFQNLVQVQKGAGETFITYDVWLVAEFIDLLEKQADYSMVICNDAENSLNARFDHRLARQRPIPAVTSTMDDGCHLYPHQNEGVRFLQDNGGRGIISFEMGLGKTATVLAYIAAEGKRAIVVCPKNVRSAWVQEALSFFSSYFQGSVLELKAGSKATDDKMTHELQQARLVTINYEILQKHLPSILQAGFDCLVLDESQYLKNPKAARTKRILEIKDNFLNRILLSGTPIKNGEKELSSQLEIVGVDIDIKDMSPGAVWNMLHERNVYIKKTLKEELSHLQFAEPVLVDIKFDPDFVAYLDDWEREDLLAQVQEKLRLAAEAKISQTCSWALTKKNEDPDSKVIIFTERVKVAEEIFSTLEEEDPDIALLHHGSLKVDARDRILESFKKDVSRRILVSTRPSLAVGVNLQCANVVIFNDMPWSPADIQQAVGRTKRLNQRKAVSEYWMKSNSLFDKNLMRILQSKIMLIMQYAEGKNMSSDQVKWMHSRVSVYDIAGIEKPKKPTKRKKRT